MNARQRGLASQRKSVKWMLEHPEKYGIIPNPLQEKERTLRSCRIFNVGVGTYSGDLFERFDIIAMPDSDEFTIWLIQVKSNSFGLNRTADLVYFTDLLEFKTPTAVRKELHIWKTRAKEPIILPC